MIRAVRARLPLSRPRAFALHLALSLLAFSTLVLAMLLWWFPGELFFLDGGWQGLKLVAMVDLVLGPLLTLLLYKPGKPKLALDLSMIALIQVAALGYGFVTTHEQRTVALVYADGVFNTLSAQAEAQAAAELREREREPRAVATLVSGSPRAGADAPVPLLKTPTPGREEFGKYLEELFNGYPEMHERSDKFVVLDANDESLSTKALKLEDLENATEREAVRAALGTAERAGTIELHRFKARYASGIALYDPTSARIVDYVAEEDGNDTTLAEGGDG